MDNSTGRATGEGFAAEVAGQQPHAVDRELSTLIQDNYAVTDARRGLSSFAPVLPGSWQRMDEPALRAAGIDPGLLHDSKSGFDASLYRDATGAVVVAYAGSDELKDWKHNLRQGLGLQDAQYDQAIALAQQAKQVFGNEVVLTGQSLGGGLAAAASMVTEVPAVTFNAAGVHDRTLERYGFDADVLKREADQGLIRTYHVKNELLTHLQEDSIPLKWAMPDAAGHKIELPDPDPLTFFERLVPGKMFKHRLDLHFIDAVMEAQDLSQLKVRERSPGAGPDTIGDAGSTSNQLLRNAVDGLSGQRQQLGLEGDERFFNVAANVALRARSDGMQRIDHLLPSSRGDGLFLVQGSMHDPAHLRSHVALAGPGQVPAQVSAMRLREHDLHAPQLQGPEHEARQQRASPL
ncbi:MAG: XVIPCD domain-containing protein [Pseudoxanthomonas sp.]